MFTCETKLKLTYDVFVTDCGLSDINFKTKKVSLVLFTAGALPVKLNNGRVTCSVQ